MAYDSKAKASDVHYVVRKHTGDYMLDEKPHPARKYLQEQIEYIPLRNEYLGYLFDFETGVGCEIHIDRGIKAKKTPLKTLPDYGHSSYTGGGMAKKIGLIDLLEPDISMWIETEKLDNVVTKFRDETEWPLEKRRYILDVRMPEENFIPGHRCGTEMSNMDKKDL